MVNPRIYIVLLALPALLSWTLDAAADADAWPSFRGPGGSGVAPGDHVAPAQWNVDSGKNILWKTRIEGLGHSCPVVWGDRVFITSALRQRGDSALKTGLYGDIGSVDEDDDHQWVLYCLDFKSGEMRWQTTVHTGVPVIRRHPKSSQANSTPATDGRRVVCFYGSEALLCHDIDGTLLWKRDFGPLDSGYFAVPSAQWGFGSSPVIYEDLVIVQCDLQKNGFLAALRLEDGGTVWSVPRQDVPTWSTPAVDDRHGRGHEQIIVNGHRHMGGYDLRTGRPLWKMASTGDIPVPTPVIAHGIAFLTNAHGGLPPIHAVSLAPRYEPAKEGAEPPAPTMAWSHARGGTYMVTPIVVGEHLYLCSNGGIFSGYEAKTGRKLFRERLPAGGGYTASLVSADGKVYATSEGGEVVVLEAGDRFNVITTSDLGEATLATPAISRGVLLFRTRNHLVAVGSM
ncbi:MAG: hypothetical protein CMJ18_04940 [Phycisphaeraceae bacterium]|nr:hypothetical protein [Phycisphaeraceae bacterium]